MELCIVKVQWYSTSLFWFIKLYIINVVATCNWFFEYNNFEQIGMNMQLCSKFVVCSNSNCKLCTAKMPCTKVRQTKMVCFLQRFPMKIIFKKTSNCLICLLWSFRTLCHFKQWLKKHGVFIFTQTQQRVRVVLP
jgi:hypothetical protein